MLAKYKMLTPRDYRGKVILITMEGNVEIAHCHTLSLSEDMTPVVGEQEQQLLQSFHKQMVLRNHILKDALVQHGIYENLSEKLKELLNDGMFLVKRDSLVILEMVRELNLTVSEMDALFIGHLIEHGGYGYG